MKITSDVKSEPQAGAPRPVLGVLEWFHPGEHERVEQVLSDLDALGVRHLRTGFSWAAWHTDEGRDWYAWLMPRLAEAVEVLPCLTRTPPALGLEPKSSAPPRRPQDYVAFVDEVLNRFADCFDWVEIWNEPTNTNDWDWHLDPDWEIFCAMTRAAARRIHAHGKRAVLAGTSPPDPNWLDLVCRRGVVAHVDAVGVRAFPGTWAFDWTSWAATLTRVREVLAYHDAGAEVWITGAGYSTWQHDEYRQLQAFVKAAQAPADRLYWCAAHDLHPERPHQGDFHEDERHYHFGLREASGRPKLLFRIWVGGGLGSVRALAHLDDETHAGLSTNGTTGNGTTGKAVGGAVPAIQRNGQRPVLITGGAGFVGTNLAHRLLADGHPVLIYDNLSRPGVEHNLRGLIEEHGRRHVSWMIEDMRNPYALRKAVAQAAQIYHFAGQVAVTTSIERPGEDFEVNVQGTMNLLEALRAMEEPPPLVFTSTNKVYGTLGRIALREEATRYVPADSSIREHGISEAQALAFRSPYGCSKGAADQYVLDYARTYGLRALVFRMSCIYGSHQFGTEDQGWVAHFARQALAGAPITLYGDGKQVRDILFVDDLVEALLLAQEHMSGLTGEAFNIGGGPGNTTSLLELIDRLTELHGAPPPLRSADWRSGDQKYYVADTSKFSAATGWQPEVGVEEGTRRLYAWLRQAQKEQQPAFRRAPVSLQEEEA